MAAKFIPCPAERCVAGMIRQRHSVLPIPGSVCRRCNGLGKILIDEDHHRKEVARRAVKARQDEKTLAWVFLTIVFGFVILGVIGS